MPLQHRHPLTPNISTFVAKVSLSSSILAISCIILSCLLFALTFQGTIHSAVLATAMAADGSSDLDGPYALRQSSSDIAAPETQSHTASSHSEPLKADTASSKAPLNDDIDAEHLSGRCCFVRNRYALESSLIVEYRYTRAPYLPRVYLSFIFFICPICSLE